MKGLFRLMDKTLHKSFKRAKKYHKTLDKWESIISVIERNTALTKREQDVGKIQKINLDMFK
ncbi:hypothetical protein LCGC14_1164560 [marine sediment metagenome]|uniref:Uncharacterized protein n=1 Tax=marine sediment metagenome TaxID=412755 RepID=A0A0F9P9Y2_9ZZZZ|nr:MAG: hypothetical protein Lokiarch_16900 [Candidatus Lokiarchaeum sp. GC14_75]